MLGTYDVNWHKKQFRVHSHLQGEKIYLYIIDTQQDDFAFEDVKWYFIGEWFCLRLFSSLFWVNYLNASRFLMVLRTWPGRYFVSISLREKLFFRRWFGSGNSKKQFKAVKQWLNELASLLCAKIKAISRENLIWTNPDLKTVFISVLCI